MRKNEPRIALRKAVEKVLGRKGSAVIGDDLYDALRADGFDVYRPDECREVVYYFDGFYDNLLTGDTEGDWESPNVPDGRYRLVPVGEGTEPQ